MHCKYCDKCILRLDHHCFYLNNCIGKLNYVAYLVAIITGSIYFGCVSLSGWFCFAAYLNPTARTSFIGRGNMSYLQSYCLLNPYMYTSFADIWG